MKKESRIYPYLLGLIFVAIVALAAGPDASGAPASADGWLGVMPPSPELWERVERGEAKLPQVMTDPDLRRSLGVNQPAEMIQPSGSWRAIALLVQFTDNPAATGAEERLVLALDRVTHWASVGAQTSERVSTLIKQAQKAAA